MDGWITFWTIACTLFFGAFYLLVLVVIPLGARDLLRLFRHLSRGSEEEAEVEEKLNGEGTSAGGSRGVG